MDTAPVQAIVLAAGLGSRLGSLTAERSKAMLDLGGRSLLQRAIDFATALGASDVIIVGGYCIEQLHAFVALLRDARVRVVENRRYDGGNLLSVLAALPHVRGAFYLTNVDHIFSAAAASRVLSSIGDDISAFCQFERAFEADEMKVTVDASRNIRGIAKTLARFDGAYCGLTHVPRTRLPDYLAAVERTREEAGDAAVAEQVLQSLADEGSHVRAASLDGVAWCEIDTPLDLMRAQTTLAIGGIQ
jgi:choline kinase